MGKVALITGSASGLAVAFARQLARDGYDLALNYRTGKERCEQLAARMADTWGIRATVFAADMSRELDVERLVDDVAARFGRLDVVVHSAGPFIVRRKRLTDYTGEEWREMIDGNLSSAFYLFRKAILLMRPQGYGRIVTIGFDRVEEATGWPYRSAYAAAKVGLASLTRSIASEERENGITANMICPGDIRGRAKESDPPHGQWQSALRAPVGGDLARVISLLLHPDAQFITGNILSLTNGEDILSHYDSGRSQVTDARTIPVGATVHVIPWNEPALVTERRDRTNRRSVYTVSREDHTAQFTVDQLEEENPNGI